MTPDNFCYWLKGFIELENPETMTKEQVEEIKRHLNIVFNTGSTVYQTQNYAVPKSTGLYGEQVVKYMPFYGSC